MKESIMTSKFKDAVCVNSKAYHDYEILETLEAGIVLTGMEVKSILAGSVSLAGSYIAVLKDELWLVGANIAGHSIGYIMSYNPKRNRKLLCHRRELLDIKYKTEAKSLTAVPLKIYLKNKKLKLMLGIARGKNKADKRHDLKMHAIDMAVSRYGR